MATRLRFRLVDGIFTLPVQYGAVVLGPGESRIIADTPANVRTALGNPSPNIIDIDEVPDGQTGAITPGVPGATSAAQAAASATSAAAASATAAFLQGYTGGTALWWATAAPTNVQNALNRIAKAMYAGGATGTMAL